MTVRSGIESCNSYTQRHMPDSTERLSQSVQKIAMLDNADISSSVFNLRQSKRKKILRVARKKLYSERAGKSSEAFRESNI